MEHPVRMLAEGAADGTPDAEDCHTCAAVWDNLFVSRVNQALERACRDDLSQDRLPEAWVGEARKAFLTRNAPALPMETLCLCDPEGNGHVMDSRCFADHFNALAGTTQENHMELQHHRHLLDDIRSAFKAK